MLKKSKRHWFSVSSIFSGLKKRQTPWRRVSRRKIFATHILEGAELSARNVAGDSGAASGQELSGGQHFGQRVWNPLLRELQPIERRRQIVSVLTSRLHVWCNLVCELMRTRFCAEQMVSLIQKSRRIQNVLLLGLECSRHFSILQQE